MSTTETSGIQFSQVTQGSFIVRIRQGKANAYLRIPEAVWLEVYEWYRSVCSEAWWTTQERSCKMVTDVDGTAKEWRIGLHKWAFDSTMPNEEVRDECVSIRNICEGNIDCASIWLPREDFDEMIAFWERESRSES